ncbi:MAG TPA: hypothetical protein VM711_05905, partial [Sphingomicrobium sp.]|nr:hypothetical protein [Sphingomicrobium sp.]
MSEGDREPGIENETIAIDAGAATDGIKMVALCIDDRASVVPDFGVIPKDISFDGWLAGAGLD